MTWISVQDEQTQVSQVLILQAKKVVLGNENNMAF